MAYLTLPTRTNHTNYSFTVALENNTYSFSFVWNYRTSFWAMSISGVVDGIAVRVGTDLLAGLASVLRPPGMLVAIDTTGQDLDPGIDELGSRVVLYYKESTT